MKLAGVVILYNPNTDVIKNIASYLFAIDRLYVYDNSSTLNSEIQNWCNQNSKIILLHDGENGGIAKRLNEASRLSINEGYDWLLTMDQDSYFDLKDLSNYLDCIKTQLNSKEIAMFGIEHEKNENGIGIQSCIIQEIEYLITSGSIINLSVFEKTGGFDELLFIDEVDLEFCYKAQTKGFKIMKFPNIYLNHHLGTVSYFRSFKTGKMTPRTLHSPLRVYYMIRNYFYVSKLYPNLFKEGSIIRKKALVNRIKNNILYGKKKLLLFVYIIAAYLDYKRNKMGKK